jgi:hypothetical protein
MGTQNSVRVSTRIAADAHDLFVLVSEHRNAVRVIEGLEQLTPIGKRTRGVGARFDAILRIGPKSVRAEIEIEELVTDRLVRWRSSHGDDRSITFDFRRAEGATAVRITVTYEGPEGLSGALLAPVVEAAVRERARGTLDRLREVAGEPAGA